MTRVHRLAWTALVLNVIVILGGALVRATGSGAGCGASWPTCEGQIIPSSLAGDTGIEFAHRAFSGVALLVVLGLFLAIRRSPSANDHARRAAVWALVTIVIEALIGAGIVLFEWVADDSSVARTVAVPLHLVNTLILLASLAAVVAFTGWATSARRRTDAHGRLVVWGIVAMLAVAASGAVAALAGVLFPADSLAEGLAQDFSGTESVLTRLRLFHPAIAFAAALVLWRIVATRPEDAGPRAARFARGVQVIVGIQLVAGVLNVVLLVPVWMQLVHLALADILWITFIWYTIEVSAQHAITVGSEP